MIRILDSRREEFRLSKAYEQKIDVVNVITAPEIEMLIIHAEGAYDQFKRSGKKPSEFCKTNLRLHAMKPIGAIVVSQKQMPDCNRRRC